MTGKDQRWSGSRCFWDSEEAAVLGGAAAVAMELCHSDLLPRDPAVGGSWWIVISCYTFGFVLRPCPSFSAPSQYGT